MTIYTQTPVRQSMLEDYTAPMSDVLGVTAEESLLYAPVSSLMRSGELTIAEQGQPNLPTRLTGAAIGAVFPPVTAYIAAGAPGLPSTFRRAPDSPLLDAETARTKVKDAGVNLNIPDKGIRSRALDILIERKKEEMRRQDVLARAPGGWGAGAARLGTALGVSAIDPLNVASAFIPVVGPARYGGMLAKAGGAFGRAAVRARVGALEGVVGAAAVEPLVLGAANQERADYGLADSLLNIGLGTVLGGGLHVGAGAASDAFSRGVDWRTAKAQPTEPLPRALDAMDFPARERALRTGVSQAVSGREINVEPLVTYEGGGARFGDELRFGEATVHEPTVKVDEVTGVEGITLYHGSPHTFERFSMDKIGTGEGAQAFGRGLYFAERPDIAEGYRQNLTARDIAALDTARDWISRAGGDSEKAVREFQAFAKEAGLRQDEVDETITFINSGRAANPFGSLYEVRLNAKPEDFLDWDKPLSEQGDVGRRVQEVLEQRGIAKASLSETDQLMSDLIGADWASGGASAYKALEKALGRDGASQALREAGISGIRYLDAGSRLEGEGSSNYVVFDDSLITTVRRNEESLLRRPEDIRTAINATFAPEASRLYDIEAVRSADAKIAEAPTDEAFPEQALESAMQDVEAMAAALDGLPPPVRPEGAGEAEKAIPAPKGPMGEMVAREMKELDELAETAEAYGRAVVEAASCGLRRGTA